MITAGVSDLLTHGISDARAVALQLEKILPEMARVSNPSPFERGHLEAAIASARHTVELLSVILEPEPEVREEPVEGESAPA